MSADLKGPVALTLASASLGAGHRSTRSATRPRRSPYAASAVQMLVGGLVITAAGPRARRRRAEWHCDRRGLGALAYLVVFGSIVGYTAYAYALRHASATIVGTYAYVNPVVAVLLGWLVLHEAVTGRTFARDGADPGRGADDPARTRSGRAGEGASGERSRREAPRRHRERRRPWIGRYAGDDELAELVVGRSRTARCPSAQWTHRAHLTVGSGTPAHLPPEAALDAAPRAASCG